MNNKLKILLAAILLAAIFTGKKICHHFGFGPTNPGGSPIAVKNEVEPSEKSVVETSDYLVDNSLYRWDEQQLRWVLIHDLEKYQKQLVTNNEVEYPSSEPIEVEWKVLMDINYKLRYFEELEMEIYAPVFPEHVKALDGKEVVLEGFVIPFDEEQELLSLSANPFASCFFCGKASPASVISMYLRNKRKRYKMDDYKRFVGTLHLNPDDPKEFYYILRDAREE